MEMMWALEYILKCVLIRYCATVRYPLVLLTLGQQNFFIALECQQSAVSHNAGLLHGLGR